MLILFGSSPLDERKVDEMYEEEYAAAAKAGFEVGLVNLEQLMAEQSPARAVRRLPSAIDQEDVLYRGWMLTPKDYAMLYEALLAKNLKLINRPEQYKHCHYLPESYAKIQEYTPKSTWLPIGEVEESEDAVQHAVSAFGQRPIIVKDYVKSRKHEWNEACYIPDASDAERVAEVVRNFVTRQGDDLNEGLVFREFAELEFLSYHARSGMPLSREMRVFFLKGEPVFVSNYWEAGEDGEFAEVLDSFLDVARSVESRFFTMDFAKRKNGGWIIMELGDGQVAGLPDGTEPQAFYASLRKGMEK